TLAALAHMRPAGAGTIVQIGSALSYRAIPLQSAYCGAKFAVRGFTDALRSELIREGSAIRLTMVQLPAVNTPQFDWSRSRLPRRPQPVPPIFQPEPIAEAIFRAAERAPRELWVGLPAVRAILGGKLVPGLLDQWLAELAYEGQMSPEPTPEHARDNLFEPVPEDRGVHGRFDDRAKPDVWSFDPALLRGGMAAAGLGVLLGAVLLGARLESGRHRPPSRWRRRA
ncbi:MAG TPA: SDR family oxidoreductase, partial [Geminicoccaceae bacterium]|nr:SDR family oxidoreductase [Geminicoccaceae bacterium]